MDGNCEHEEEHRVYPPPPKVLRICTSCCTRLIECSTCSAVITAGPHIADSGWMKGGTDYGGETVSRWYACPDCYSARYDRR
jgi:hypothetical protein